MAFEGMDIGAVRQLANLMRQKADEIDHIISQLTGSVNNTQWVGPDRDRFIQDWQSSHVPALKQVEGGLRDAATLADGNATQQEQASH